MRDRLKRWLTQWGVPAFYWWAVHALRFVLWVVARWKVTGRERVPASGAVIVASNHLNNTDPPILASAIKSRRVRYMAKIELFKYPFGIVPRAYGAFPVRRFDSDIGALMAAERILRQGGVLGMFPEGTRSRTGYMGKPHPGTAMIALRTGATVLPCAITGTEQIRNPLVVFKKPKISVTIGEPIEVERVKKPTEEQVTALTRRIVDAIAAMLPAQYLPPYTGDEATEGGVPEVQVAANGGNPPGE